MSQDKPHDSLFRFAWSDLATARSHFENILPPTLIARLDWGTLKLGSGSFVDEAFKDFHSDLLFEVYTQDGNPVLLYMLFEHQSSMDPKMAFRVLVYMSRIWENHLRQYPKTKKLPPILPLVLYHGKEKWTAPVEFSQLVDVDEDLRPALQPYLPTFQYLLEDLSTVPDDALRGTALRRMALLLLKHANDGDLWQQFAGWMETVKTIMTEREDGLKAVEALFRYIVLVTPTAPPPEVRAAFRAYLGSQTEEQMVSWAEQLREEGRNEGLAKGLDVVRHAILQVLSTRFPKADWSDMAHVLGSQSVEVLEQLLTDAATTSSARQFRATLGQRVGGRQET